MNLFVSIGLIFFLFTLIRPCRANVQLAIESGLVWQLRNDLQRPQNTSATKLALDEIDQGPENYYRIEAHLRINENHGLRILYAPLELEVSNSPSSPLTYNNVEFAANTPTN